MRKTIVEHVADGATRNPEKLAVMTPCDSVSYGALYEYARGYASFLVSSGLEHGDIVVLRATQTIEYAIQYLGIHLAGGVVTSLGRTVSDGEMVTVAKSIGASSIIMDGTHANGTCSALAIPQGNVRDIASRHVNNGVELRFPDLSDPADTPFSANCRLKLREGCPLRVPPS